MMSEVGARVRTYHGSPGVTGVILGPAEPSDINGEEQVLVRWEGLEGGPRESRWSPKMLVSAETPREDDPPFVFMKEWDGKHYWFTARGVVATKPGETPKVEPPGLSMRYMGDGVWALKRED